MPPRSFSGRRRAYRRTSPPGQRRCPQRGPRQERRPRRPGIPGRRGAGSWWGCSPGSGRCRPPPGAPPRRCAGRAWRPPGRRYSPGPRADDNELIIGHWSILRYSIGLARSGRESRLRPQAGRRLRRAAQRRAGEGQPPASGSERRTGGRPWVGYTPPGGKSCSTRSRMLTPPGNLSVQENQERAPRPSRAAELPVQLQGPWSKSSPPGAGPSGRIPAEGPVHGVGHAATVRPGHTPQIHHPGRTDATPLLAILRGRAEIAAHFGHVRVDEQGAVVEGAAAVIVEGVAGEFRPWAAGRCGRTAPPGCPAGGRPPGHPAGGQIVILGAR